MKVLIWIGYILVTSIATLILQDSGILLKSGGMLTALLYIGTTTLAIMLCKKLDWYRIKKNATKAGMTVSEYGKKGLSQEFLTTLEKLCNTTSYERVKVSLKKCVKKGKITKEQYIILLKEYSTTK